MIPRIPDGCLTNSSPTLLDLSICLNVLSPDALRLFRKVHVMVSEAHKQMDRWTEGDEEEEEEGKEIAM